MRLSTVILSFTTALACLGWLGAVAGVKTDGLFADWEIADAALNATMSDIRFEQLKSELAELQSGCRAECEENLDYLCEGKAMRERLLTRPAPEPCE